jgi:hypothetical protein
VKIRDDALDEALVAFDLFVTEMLGGVLDEGRA